MKLGMTIGLYLFLATSLASAQLTTLRLCLDGGQEVPPVTTTGFGQASVLVDMATNLVTVTGLYNNLSSDQVSVAIYHGGLTVDSNVVLMQLQGLGGTDGAIFGQGTLSAIDAARIRDGQTYLNILTTGHPGGEIRGHIVQQSSLLCPAELPGDPVLSDTSGHPFFGPKIGNPTEAFNVSLDCSNSPSAGVYSISIKAQKTAGLPSRFGTIWSQNPRLLRTGGVHARNLVSFAPADIVLPVDITLVGRRYVVQGYCGGTSGRVSNAIVEMVGIGS